MLGEQVVSTAEACRDLLLVGVTVDALICTACSAPHTDLGWYATNARRTHLCLSCNILFPTLGVVGNPLGAYNPWVEDNKLILDWTLV